jgi:phage terminase small subunit
MALTPKQETFVREYLIDLNATQAAIRAGYSAKTAKQQGARLLTNVDVSTALTEAKTARSEKTQINAEWVLNRLAADATADLAMLYDEAGSLKPIHEWPMVFRTGLVAGIEVEELFEGRGDAREHIGRVRKIKLLDRTKVVELVGKHVDVSAFKEATATTNVNVTLNAPTYRVVEE